MMWWYQAGDAGWIGFMFALLLAAAIGLLVAWPGTIRASLILIVLIVNGSFYWNRR
jgi:hypothetical protein